MWAVKLKKCGCAYDKIYYSIVHLSVQQLYSVFKYAPTSIGESMCACVCTCVCSLERLIDL